MAVFSPYLGVVSIYIPILALGGVSMLFLFRFVCSIYTVVNWRTGSKSFLRVSLHATMRIVQRLQLLLLLLQLLLIHSYGQSEEIAIPWNSTILQHGWAVHCERIHALCVRACASLLRSISYSRDGWYGAVRRSPVTAIHFALSKCSWGLCLMQCT